MHYGDFIHFLCLYLEFDKNANSIGMNIAMLVILISLATIGVCVFCAAASVAALFIFRGILMANILADEQQKIFEPGISSAERENREQAFYDLYYKTRKKDENSFLGKLSLETRRKLHKLVLLIFAIKNRLSGFSCQIIHDKREQTNRPIIFALTHVGKFDIEVSAVGIKDHFYLLSGDYEHLQGLIDGAFLLVNGVLYFNEKVKQDRHDVVNRMIDHLKQGGNLMYFPEGTWNLKPELPMLPCYWGIVDIAQKSNAIVVPVAVEQYGKRFKINIGHNFDMQNYGTNSIAKAKAISDLRDIMATLKYDIWESEPRLKRNELVGDEWDRYIKDRLAEWPYFSLEYIDGMIYKPKNITTSEEAFKHLNTIRPTMQNAFLYNKRMRG